MYRIVIILVLLTLLYFLLRSAIRRLQEREGGGGLGRQLPDKDQMIQDPNCRVFVPRGAAVQERIGGQTYFFCSRDCARAFEKQLSA
jgi:YHS domain-containing protein